MDVGAVWHAATQMLAHFRRGFAVADGNRVLGTKFMIHRHSSKDSHTWRSVFNNFQTSEAGLRIAPLRLTHRAQAHAQAHENNKESEMKPIVLARALVVLLAVSAYTIAGDHHGNGNGNGKDNKDNNSSSAPQASQPDANENADEGGPYKVKAFAFDPNQTRLVASDWIDGAGCPTGATMVPFGGAPASLTDEACPTGDIRDKHNAGLLLVKTGPTPNYASAAAEIQGVEGITLTEIGYDIRAGSHCGAGAPRFNVVTSDDVTHFIGCASPAPKVLIESKGWKRLRYDTAAAFPPIAAGSVVKSITIVFDEGQDAGAFSGQAILDNIDINGTLIGKKQGGAQEKDQDKQNKDKDEQ